MAFGGSSNTALHLRAIAHEGGITLPLSLFDEISEKVPHICNMSPAGPHHLEDLFEAGGVYGIMKELSKRKLINKRCLNVTGSRLGDVLKAATVSNREVIHPLDAPYHEKEPRRYFWEPCSAGCNCETNRCYGEGMAICGKSRVFESEGTPEPQFWWQN
jgi:dihydroxy-acid dehydratase